jgi:hypothetical protein
MPGSSLGTGKRSELPGLEVTTTTATKTRASPSRAARSPGCDPSNDPHAGSLFLAVSARAKTSDNALGRSDTSEVPGRMLAGTSKM